MLAALNERLRKLKRETHALYLAARHPRTPWYAKLFVAGVVAYAVSPIDLIPDFIPVLGLLDDMLLIPIGIMIAVRLIPRDVLAECRASAQQAEGGPSGRVAAAIVIVIWIVLTALCALWGYRAFAGNAA
jgi:uncharacterized membrane protein YkvA (DUF1232 family)